MQSASIRRSWSSISTTFRWTRVALQVLVLVSCCWTLNEAFSTTTTTSPAAASSRNHHLPQRFHPNERPHRHHRQQQQLARPPSWLAAPLSPTALQDRRLERDIDEASRRNAQGSGAGETAAGAVLGGLLFGPFGALFGASVGSNIGAMNAVDRARQAEMDRLGISQDMLDSAREIGVALERSNEGLKASQDSLDTQQRLARRLDSEANILYDRAMAAMQENNEGEARKYLLERTKIQDRLKQVLLQCADEKGRLQQMESNVAALETRAMEIDSLLRRTVGAKAVQDSNDFSSSMGGLSLSREDPLLQKFRDLGID